MPQLCTKTPDKQIQNVESTCFTRKISINLNVQTNLDLPIDKPWQGGKSQTVILNSFGRWVFSYMISWVLQIENLAVPGIFKRKGDLILWHKTSKRQKNLRTASQACHLNEANIRTPSRKLAERKSSWPGFICYRRLRRGSLPLAVFVLRTSPCQAGSRVNPFAAQLACRGEISALPRWRLVDATRLELVTSSVWRMRSNQLN